VGTLLGKAQRYVADVKAEVNRSMELDELKQDEGFGGNAARRGAVHPDQRQRASKRTGASHRAFDADAWNPAPAACEPAYASEGKTGASRKGAMPQWYKAARRARTKQSAARVRATAPLKSSTERRRARAWAA
jgi:sec-independent protein translocase protein TatB